METFITPRSPEAKLPFTGLFHPLGYPLEVLTNNAGTLTAAAESWGAFQKLFDGNPIRLRIDADESDMKEPGCLPAYETQAELFTISCDEANSAVCDLVHGSATARVAGATVRSRAWFRYYFLDAMGYSLIDAKMFTPVHAGCVSLDGRGVLLCGDSGAGKSSLSYACAREGWTYTSDDASHLIRGQLTVVGASHELRLREPARDLFPELRDRQAAPRATGKSSIEIPTAEFAGIRTAPRAGIAHVVFLNRRPGPAELHPYSREEAFRRMASVLTFAKGGLRDAHHAALRKLLTVDVFELSYDDPGAAVDQLRNLVRRD